ncbi:MAG: glycine cleavage system protein T [Actinobacteria bacterium QS_8_72_14]|nr:MAG: glycine cleavage system protein T [Actinobacteria bacterium QS_8_72_14]
MSTLPDRADVVVIGAGIVGNSVVAHLADKGWRSIVQVDQGPLPDPGGSTGHASNFIFPVDHSKEITQLTVDSQRQYEAMGVQTTCGGIELARTPQRMEELRRRMASATAWGVDAELLSRREVTKHLPFINDEVILGGFYTPSASVVDSLHAGTLLRQHALDAGALTVSPYTAVTGIDTDAGHITGVHTDRGTLATEAVVVACGVWSPVVARMAGGRIPLVPVVHQLIDVGPIPEFEATGTGVAYPMIRDMDTLMYERQDGADMEIGSYAHRPIVHNPEDIPSIEEAALSPTQLPFTEQDFEPQMADALELMPEVLNAPGAGVRHAINGLLSYTADGSPLLGETPEVAGLWSAAAVWIKEGPAVGRMLAQWMTDGATEVDSHSTDIARLYPHQRTRAFVRARAEEGFNKIYGIVHPGEQWESGRDIRRSPFHERTAAAGAVYYEAGGWERPHWYESNRELVAEYGVANRAHEWDRRWWSPIITAEHLALRHNAGMIDLTAFAQFEVAGPGALDYLQGMVVAQLDRPVGRIVYTPVLDPNGGFRSDLTIVRLDADRFRIITGGSDGARDKKWFSDHLPVDGSATLTDVSSAVCTVGVWGPRARDVVAKLAAEDISHEAFPFGAARWVTLGSVDALLVRISYVGDLGWEIHAPFESGGRLWDDLAEAGRPQGLVPVGAGVYGATGRMEKGYRLMGHELEAEYDPVEAGLALPRVKQQDFIGKDAYLAAREGEPAATLCTLTVESHRSEHGIDRFPLGHEPILDRNGRPIVDAKGRRSFVTSAGSGPSLGKHLLMSYLPPEHAVEGNRLQVEYMGEHYPVKVARVGRTPLFDPEDTRMKS